MNIAPSPSLPSRFNMARYCLAEAARTSPSKTALIVIDDAEAILHGGAPSEEWTYAAIEDAVLRVAGALQDAGLKRGDRIMIRLDNTSTYAVLFFGAIAAGLVALPASSQLTPAEAQFLLENSGAAALALAPGLDVASLPPGVRAFTTADVETMLRAGRRADYADTGADDPAYLIYTSGTTARPKGVLHAQRAAFGRRPMYQGWYGIGPDDRVLHAGAFNWTFTLGTGLTDPWANGATAIINTGKKDPALWPELIRLTGATIFAAVPGLLRQILKYGGVEPGRMPTLRHALTAGESPPSSLFDEWRLHTGTELYEALGMSEISTYISTGPGIQRKPGAVGKPQPGRRIAILPVDAQETPLPAGQEGLIAVHRSDPGLMLGYWNRPEEESAVYRGEWFIGGDLGVMDDDGYVTHLGRNNDLMNALGYRVSPLEVEAVLAAHPDVAEVACSEIQVRDDVHVIGAFVVPKSGATPAADAIRAFAAERLAAYKCPREIRFIEALPRTANGKVRRSALAELIHTPRSGS